MIQALYNKGMEKSIKENSLTLSVIERAQILIMGKKKFVP
jgi:hypothetical protein